jgi:hypothetical protein
MSLSAEVFGSDSWIHKLVNIGGLGVPGWLDRKFGTGNEARENALGDISKQTAEEGGARTIVWGRVRPIGGNIIYCQQPQTRWVLTYEETEGKGGGGEEQEVWTERVYRTYAIGICEGAISRIVRVWKNNKLVYDARGNAWGARNNPSFLAGVKIYKGGFTQLPCPELQAIWGSNIPAHRGTAYIVFIDQDLTTFAGAVPQYQFEVERAEGTYLTSKPYAVEISEALEIRPIEAEAPFVVPFDLMSMSAPEITDGSLRSPYVDYTDGIPEAVENVPAEITEGELRNALIDYTDGLPEAVENYPAEITEGELRVALIDYTDWPVEALDAEPPQITGGSLT